MEARGAPIERYGRLSYPPFAVCQQRPDRARRLGDVGEQLSQRVPHRQRPAAPCLGRQHVVDQHAAMQNALLLTPERLDLRERRGRVRAAVGGRGARAVNAVAAGATPRPWSGRTRLAIAPSRTISADLSQSHHNRDRH
jgi:hypothetical protein